MLGVLLCAGCAPVSRLPVLSEDEIEAEKRIEQIAHIRGMERSHQIGNIDRITLFER